MIRLGWMFVAREETWNYRGRTVTRDVMGFADSVWMKNEHGTAPLDAPIMLRVCAVQATSAPNKSARLRKIAREPRATDFLKHGGTIWLMTWRKGVGAVIVPEILEISEADLREWR